MKNLISISAALMTATILSSCTVNEYGEPAATWVFWVCLCLVFAVVVVAFIAAIATSTGSAKEAKRRGITEDQLYEEELKDFLRQEMEDGSIELYLDGCSRWKGPCLVRFSVCGTDVIISKGSDTLTISAWLIIDVYTEKTENRSSTKGVVGGALGWIVGGWVGSLAGISLGLRKSTTSDLFLTYVDEEDMRTLHFRPGRDADRLCSWVKAALAETESPDDDTNPPDNDLDVPIDADIPIDPNFHSLN